MKKPMIKVTAYIGKKVLNTVVYYPSEFEDELLCKENMKILSQKIWDDLKVYLHHETS